MTEIHTLSGLATRLRGLTTTLAVPAITADLELAATVLERRAEEVGDDVCRKCGCGELDPCGDGMFEACHWAEPGLCSACAETPPA